MDDQDSLHLTDSSSESDTGSESVMVDEAREFKQSLAAANPIFEAIFNENIEGIKGCLKKVEGSGYIGNLRKWPFNINDALYWACYYGHVLSVECLLAEGADPEKKPIHGLSDYPIHGACYGGLEVLDVIMMWWRRNRGPRVCSGVSVSPFLDARDKYINSTALHVATRHKNVEVVNYLLQNGANPCLQDLTDKVPIQYTQEGTPLFQTLWAFMNMFSSYQKRDKLHKSPGGMEDGPAAGNPNVAKFEEIASSS